MLSCPLVLLHASIFIPRCRCTRRQLRCALIGVVGVFEPTDEQLESVEHIIENLLLWPGFILADDTGLGKTLIALMVADHIAGDAGRVPILAPAVVVSAWHAHVAQRHPSRDVRSIVGSGGSAGGGIEAFMTGTHWLVTSYDYFAIPHDAFLKTGAEPVAVLVCDEAHLLGRWRTLRRESVSTFLAEKVLLLTGTLCSDLMQLWSLLDLTHPGCAADPDIVAAHGGMFRTLLRPGSASAIDESPGILGNI